MAFPIVILRNYRCLFITFSSCRGYHRNQAKWPLRVQDVLKVLKKKIYEALTATRDQNRICYIVTALLSLSLGRVIWETAHNIYQSAMNTILIQNILQHGMMIIILSTRGYNTISLSIKYKLYPIMKYAWICSCDSPLSFMLTGHIWSLFNRQSVVVSSGGRTLRCAPLTIGNSTQWSQAT
jgi:hypothetical protein